jgi:hypothetical protein
LVVGSSPVVACSVAVVIPIICSIEFSKRLKKKKEKRLNINVINHGLNKINFGS